MVGYPPAGRANLFLDRRGIEYWNAPVCCENRRRCRRWWQHLFRGPMYCVFRRLKRRFIGPVDCSGDCVRPPRNCFDDVTADLTGLALRQ